MLDPGVQGWGESRVCQGSSGVSVQPSSPPQQAVVLLGGTFMWQVSAQASEAVIK